jgi:hypothetical protein
MSTPGDHITLHTHTYSGQATANIWIYRLISQPVYTYIPIGSREEINRIGRLKTSTSEHFGLEDIARAHHTIVQFHISLEEIT